MATADIGLIGLGTMGSNLALNIAEKGHKIAVFNRTPARTDHFVETAGELRDRIVPCASIADLAAAIRPPRPVIVMVQAGAAVDEQIALLRPVLSANDIIIDAGNANFHDTVRRFSELAGSGLTFIGMGVSGGEEGARHGPSIMVGGTRRSMRGSSRCSPPSRPNTMASPARPGWVKAAPAISSRPSTTASNMPTCR